MREALDLIRDAIRGHQRQSEAILHRSHLMREALNLIREAIKGHPSQVAPDEGGTQSN
jgi:hypothetical protein